MRLCYENTIDDLVAFQHHFYRSSGNVTRNKRIAVVVIYSVFIIFSLVAPTTNQVSRTSLILIMIAAATLAVVLYGWLINWCMTDGTKRLYGEGSQKGVIGAHELSFTDQGLLEKNDVGETLIYWHGIQRIDETDDYVFVFLTTMQAHAIPRHSVTEGELAAFVSELKQIRNQKVGLEN